MKKKIEVTNSTGTPTIYLLFRFDDDCFPPLTSTAWDGLERTNPELKNQVETELKKGDLEKAQELLEAVGYTVTFTDVPE